MRKNVDKSSLLFWFVTILILINAIAMIAKYGWVSSWNYSQSEMWHMQLELWFGWL